MECVDCGMEFILHKNKRGRINQCEDCADDVVRYTGNMVYDHKAGCSVQINSDPRLTSYINKATRLQNKGSNLGNNLKVDSSMVYSNGLVHSAGDRNRRKD